MENMPLLPTLEELESISKQKQKEFEDFVVECEKMRDTNIKRILPEILLKIKSNMPLLQKKKVLDIYTIGSLQPGIPSCRDIKDALIAELARQNISYLQVYDYREIELFVRIKPDSPACFTNYIRE